MPKTYFTYIMSNKSRGVYVGSTSDLQVRVSKHYFETYSHPSDAIAREKELKGLAAGREAATRAQVQSALRRFECRVERG